MQAYFDVCLPDERGTITLSESEVYRLVCHALVQQLPDKAFAEAFESLHSMFEFYQHAPKLIPASTPQPVTARITGSYTAPVFPATEE